MLRKSLYQLFIVTAIVLMALFSVDIQGDEQSDEVDGTISTIGTNNDSKILGLELQQFEDPQWDAVVTNGTEGVNPVAETYRMYLNFSDIDGINDIHDIEFKFFNLNYPSSEIRRSFDDYTNSGIKEFDASNPNNPFMVSDDSFIVRWSQANGFEAIGLDNDETWELVNSSFETVSQTEFVLRVDFKISKVALHNNLWYLGALITNGADSDLTEETFSTEGPYVVNWYGEVVIPDNSEVRWEDVNAGSDFGDPNTESYITEVGTGNRVTVTYISNGYYQQRVKSSASWEATESSLPVVGNDNFAYLTTEASISNFTAQAFGVDVALEYDNPDNRQVRLDTELKTFRNHELDANYDLLNPNIWRSRTPETGQGFYNFVFRVAISEFFQNATYVGDITVGIRNEADIISFSEYEQIADETAITTTSYVGIYASNQEEFITLIQDTDVQLPIYLRNGFVEITTDSAITGTNQALKPVIGDVFISGNGTDLSEINILYGDLYVLGDNVQISDVNLNTHLDQYIAATNSLSSSGITLSALTDAPGGNLHIEGLNFTGSNIEINSSLYLDSSAIANLVGSSNIIGENVFVQNNSSLTLSNYTISSGHDSLYFGTPSGNPDSGLGDITLSTNSSIILGSNVQFADLSLSNSTGATINSGQRGWTLTLSDSSEFDWNDGRLNDVYLTDQSSFSMTDGDIDDTLDALSSDVVISGGHVGSNFDTLDTNSVRNFRDDTFASVTFDDSDFDMGIILDDVPSAPETASNLTISGSTAIVENVKARHNSKILMIDGTIDSYSQISESVELIQEGGEIHRLRAYDASTLDFFGGEVGKLYLFETTQTLVSGGTLGLSASPNDSFVSVNDTSRLNVVNASTIALDDIYLQSERNKNDNNIIDDTRNYWNLYRSNVNGLQIRDNAVVTIGALVTIDSSTDLELRDNATLTVLTSDTFNRMLYDWSATFNEYNNTEGSSISNGSSSYVDFYVKPQGDNASTTRVVRPSSSGTTPIDYDFTRIEGVTPSAFNEARRIKSEFGYNSTVYLSEGSYLDENSNTTLNLDIDNLWIAFSPGQRTVKKGDWNSTFMTSAEGLAGNHIALFERPVLMTASNNRSHGLYFDLDNQNILISSSAQYADFVSNYVVQDNANTPIIDVRSYQFTIDSNYLTRPVYANDTPAIDTGIHLTGLEGANFTSSIVDNYINNIGGDAVLFDEATVDSRIDIRLNIIGQINRTVQGHAFNINNVELSRLDFQSNTLSYLSNSAILVSGATLQGDIDFYNNSIRDFDSGHGIHLHDVIFDDTTNTVDTYQFRFQHNNIDNNNTVSNAVLIDGANLIEKLRILNEDYSDLENGFVITNSATIEDIIIESGTFSNLNQTAFIFETSDWIKDVIVDGGTYQGMNTAFDFRAANNIDSLEFTHNDRYINGHRIENDNSHVGDDTIIRGSISDISQSAILVNTVSMASFSFSGFVLSEFALNDSDDFAGIDLNVTHLSGTSINQALRKNNVVYSLNGSSAWRFDNYSVIDASFENGDAPAIRFYVTDSGIYANNVVFNPDIESNDIGIEFNGGLTSSDAIVKLFGSSSNFVLNSDQADLRALLISQGAIANNFYANDFNRLVNASVSGLTAVGLRNNDIEIRDETNTIDFDAFRTTYADLGYQSPSDTLFINTIDNATVLMVIPKLDQSGLAVNDAVDQVTLVTTSSGVDALLELDYFLDGTSIRGVAVDDLNDQSGNLELSVNAASGATKAIVYVETEGNTVLDDQRPNVSSGIIKIRIPVATTNGSVWTPIGADTKYRVVINWLDGSNSIISDSAFTLSIDRSSESPFITAITSAASGADIESLLNSELLGLIDGSVSNTALFSNLKTNIDTDTYSTNSDFETLLQELATYELALINSLSAANSLDVNANIPVTLLEDVIDSMTNTSITFVDDGIQNLESIDDLRNRLIVINISIGAVESQRWVREDLIDNGPYDTFSELESSLTSIVNALTSRMVYDPNALTVSPASMLVTTNTSITTIRDYLDSDDSNYPRYVTGGVTEVLVPVDDWEFVGANWETSNDSPGVYEFVRTFRFPNGSDQFFDADRTTSMAISVTVSTIHIDSGLPEVSFEKTTADTNATLNIAYTLDDDDSTIIGELSDRIDALTNESITMAVAAPAGVPSVDILITYNGSTTTTTDTPSGNQIEFAIPIATPSGVDYEALADNSSFVVEIQWKDDSGNTLYSDFITIKINRNDVGFITSLNNASTANELKDLLDTATQQMVADSAVNNTEFYDALFVNVNSNTFNTFSSFETLFNELLNYQETMITAVAFAESVTGDTTVNANFYNTLILDVRDSLNGTFIDRVYGDTVNASTVINNLGTLSSNLQSVSERKWIAEEIEALNDSFTDYEDLINDLESIFTSLEDLVIYDPDRVIPPTPIIVATGISLLDIQTRLDAESNRPLYTNEDTSTEVLSPNGSSDWALVSGDLNQEGVYTLTREFVFAVTSNNFGDITRSRVITVLTTVSTISTDSLTEGVTFSKDATTNESTLDLAFDVDSDGVTVRGEALDRIDTDNGEVVFNLQVPSNVNYVQIVPYQNEQPSTALTFTNINNGIVSFTAVYAEQNGTDWELVPESRIYRFDVHWYETSNFGTSSDIIFTQQLIVNISHTTSSAIQSINNASDGAALEALLNDAFTNQVSNASINANDYYDLLVSNLDNSSVSIYSEFTTLFDDLLTVEIARYDSFNYAKNTLSSDESSPDLDILILDIVNAVSGSSVVKVDDGSLIDAQVFANRLHTLHVSLSAITEPIWISEDLVGDRANFSTFAQLETSLTTIANNLEGHQVYDSEFVQVSPSGVTGVVVSAGSSLNVIRDEIDSTLTASYPKYVDSGFDVTLENIVDWSPDGIGNWNSSTEQNTPGTYVFEATFKFPDGSKLYSNSSRDQNIQVTIIVTVE